MPEWLIVKCRLLGVTVPLSRWCGVRACELRNSLLGLLSVRTTFFSNRDGVCSTGVAAPFSRLHGASLSGSAAALVSPAPADTAPANTTPPRSNARRSSRPLPATGSRSGERPHRRTVMGASPCVANGEGVERSAGSNDWLLVLQSAMMAARVAGASPGEGGRDGVQRGGGFRAVGPAGLRHVRAPAAAFAAERLGALG